MNAGSWRRHGPVLALLSVYALVILLTFRDFGITFDEPWHAEYGRRILSWYRWGLSDRAGLEAPILVTGSSDPMMDNMSYYGGFFDATAELASRLSPLGHFETRHLVNGAFGVAGAAFGYLLGSALAGPLAGFLAALFLVLTPFYFGHAINNPKDLPFAVLYLGGVYGIVRVCRALPAPPWRDMVVIAVLVGLCMAIRFPGILLLGYLSLAFLGWAAGRDWHGAVAGARQFTGRFLATGALAYLVMLPWWPAALRDPLGHPLRTIRALGSFHWNYEVRFGGADILAGDLPWYYVAKHGLLTLPEFVLLGLLAAGVIGGTALVRGRSRREVTTPYFVVLVAGAFPLGYAVITDATVYDGLRHFIFAFLPLIVLSACGAAALLRGPRRVAVPAIVLGMVMLGATIREMVLLHPHQYAYFNYAVAGGLGRAHVSYETDYWGNSFKEAAEWVGSHYVPRGADQPIRVATCSHPVSTRYYLPPAGFTLVGQRDAPDLFLGSARFGCWDAVPGAVVHSIERRGAPLAVIKEVGDGAASLRRVADRARQP